MKTNNMILAIIAWCTIAGPASAGQGADTTTVERDYTLSNGVGTTGPGMSGYMHQGMQDHAAQVTSFHNGKSGAFRVTDGFSRRPVYNNTIDIALPHIR